MNKLIQILAIGLAILTTAIATTSIGLVTQQQTAYASFQKGECVTVPSNDEDLEGWTIETCANGDQTWISPSGKRCSSNLEGGTTACEGSPPISVN